MNLGEALGNLLRGSGRGPRQVEMLPGESEVLRTPASLRPGGLDSVGGDLLLTNMRVIFAPLNVKDLGAVLTWGLSKAGAGRVAGPLVDHGVKGTGDVVDIGGGLGGIATVEIGSPAKMLKPPTLLLQSADGTVTEIGILRGRMSRNGDNENALSRDTMVAAIQKQLG